MPPRRILRRAFNNPQLVALDIAITSIRVFGFIPHLPFRARWMSLLIPRHSATFSDQVFEAYPCGTPPPCTSLSHLLSPHSLTDTIWQRVSRFIVVTWQAVIPPCLCAVALLIKYLTFTRAHPVRGICNGYSFPMTDRQLSYYTSAGD